MRGVTSASKDFTAKRWSNPNEVWSVPQGRRTSIVHCLLGAFGFCFLEVPPFFGGLVEVHNGPIWSLGQVQWTGACGGSKSMRD